jgi:hypothetical protein|nr:MAG TPA: hypothetical protein [Caudoviricetes sp.]
MTEEQENMVKAKLAEIADAIPECKGAVFAISTGNDGEVGDVTVFKSAGAKELVNLFDNIAAQVAITLAMETTPEKVVELIRSYGDAAPLVLTYGFLTTIRAGLAKCLDAAKKEQLDESLKEVIHGGH